MEQDISKMDKRAKAYKEALAEQKEIESKLFAENNQGYDQFEELILTKEQEILELDKLEQENKVMEVVLEPVIEEDIPAEPTAVELKWLEAIEIKMRSMVFQIKIFKNK